MSNYIRTDVEITVKEGMLDEFRSLTGKMIQNTAAKEPDALVYEWYISEDGRESHLLETFKDSDAFLVHLENLTVFLDRFGNCRPSPGSGHSAIHPASCERRWRSSPCPFSITRTRMA